MADYDNGLPPSSTDVNDSSINSVIVGRSQIDEINETSINSVIIGKAEYIQKILEENINSVLLKREKSGKNRSIFL